MRNKKSVFWALLTLAMIPELSHSQGYTYVLPDTLWAQVIFYDFRADGSNPNFQQASCGNKTGMIRDTLDRDRKPILRANICSNDRISEWYRPSGRDTSKFIYNQQLKRWQWTGLTNYLSRPNEWVGRLYSSSYDMKNIVMYDSLPFTLRDSATGTYEFVRSMNLGTKQQFFWLDGKGYGQEPAGSGHNYSFTMEMHHEFVYKGGEFFNFRGDDDVWVFINGKLALDLGGIHAEASKPLSLDAIASQFGLVKGQKYMFDFFYAERRTTQANCVITTNLLTPTKPNLLMVTTDSVPPNPKNPPKLSDTTITAGQCLKFYAWVADDTLGLRPEWARLVRWEIVDTLGNNVVLDTVSSKNSLCLLKAHGCVKVYLTFADPMYPDVMLRDSIIICIRPGAPHHLNIEGSPDLSGKSRFDNPLPSLTIAATDSVGYGYAIIRDQYGNFVAHSDSTQWSVIAGATIVSASSANWTLGQGTIRKVGPAGSAQVKAQSLRYPGIRFADTLPVIVAQTAYSQIRITTGIGGQRRRIDTLAIRMATDTVLYAQGLRVDGLGWETINVRWSLTNISTGFRAPASDSVWTLRPLSIGTGRLQISSGSLVTSIPVTVLPGGPALVEIYPRTGTPGTGAGNTKYNPPASNPYTVASGSTFPLIGKVFDSYGTWLSYYETDPVLSSRITWEVRLTATGAVIDSTFGRLVSQSGAITGFTARRAFQTLDLIATFQEGSLLFRDTVRIRTVAGAPDHLVIEPTADSSQSPNRDNPVGLVRLLSSDSTQKVYAIVRDANGNYIGPANPANWSSGDASVVTASNGALSLGEGVIRRISDSRKETWVYAMSAAMVDSVRVLTDSISFTALRIVVNSGGLRDIDTLRMRTDQDTTLLALGRRSDNGQWVNVGVRWTSTGLTLDPAAPALSDRWRFSPSVVGAGAISVSLGNVTDRVVVIVNYSLPVRLALYPLPGTPDSANNRQYPPTTQVDTVIAGTPVQAVAKLFGSDGLWLRQFETPDSPIVWKIRELSGVPPTGITSPRSGFRTVFTPTRAGNTVELAAEYTTATGQLVTAAIRLFVKPGPVHRLVIEPSPYRTASPYADNPLGTVSISKNDTATYAYAVYRDQFGNFIGTDSTVAWSSLASTVIEAYAGVRLLGEGVIVRKADAGEALVVARSGLNPSLTDTILVKLATVGYDSLRIVVRDSLPIKVLTMPTDRDTVLQVQGKRSDNDRWEPVGATWTLSQGLTTNAKPPASADRWAFTPTDTGAGWIRVALGNDGSTVPCTVRVIFTTGRALTLALYPSQGTPSATNVPYPPANTPIGAIAGRPLEIVAKLFDSRNTWLSQYETGGDSITWMIEEVSGTGPTGNLSAASGAVNTYTPLRAHNTVKIIATLRENNRVLSDTILLSVQPGPVHHLVLEANQNWQTSPNRDNPIDTLVITTVETYRRLYAILRDSLGNFVAYSQQTDWLSKDQSIVTAADGITGIGEGIVTRILSGKDILTRVSASSRAYPGLADSVVIKILNIYYKELRIVLGTDTIPISNLVISTNDDTTLRVIGRRSDNNEWMPIQAHWEASPGLRLDPSAPEWSGTWRFSPVTPGSGWIRVSVGNDSISVPDTVFVTFTRGDPVALTIDLITPPEERIAGDTLVAVVKVRNKDGFMPGSDYCPSVAYWENLGSGGRTELPRLLVDQTQDTLRSRLQDREFITECFTNGIDTIRFILYYAPVGSDSLNQLTVQLGGLQASTLPFRLLPAEIDTIKVVDQNGRVFSDTTLRAPSQYLYAFSSGFDRYGNPIGPVVSNWKIDEGDLHALTRPDRVSSIYYSTEDVLYNERGCISVVYANNPTISTRFCVTIVAPPAAITRAVTRDRSGNGYLDAIELSFTRPVTIPGNYDLSKLRVVDVRSATAFRVDSIVGGLGRKNERFVALLSEQKTSQPQTNWLPSVEISGIPESETAMEAVCVDGAGPVIWSVAKVIEDINDRTKDVITVTFSEDFQGGNQAGFRMNNHPDSVFVVWTRIGPDSFIPAPSMLTGIAGFRQSTSTSLKFAMTNGKDLTAVNYLSILSDTTRWSSNHQVVDRIAPPNPPEVENRKVPVVVEPAKPKDMKVTPNPARAVYSGQPFSIEHNERARQWAVQDGRGVVLSFPLILIPGAPFDVIHGTMQIYDMAGNLVARSSRKNMLSTIPSRFADGGVHQYDIYWTGMAENGRVVAPGAYRAILRLDYTGSTVLDRTFIATIGIRN